MIQYAYEAGYQAGQADAHVGVRSDYAWYGMTLDHPSTYSHRYSVGYRAGWLSRTA